VRPVALDQRVFQPQGFQLAFLVEGVVPGDDELDVDDMLAQAARFLVGDAAMEVAAHPVVEVLGLADVDDRPAGVLHQVDAGPVRQVIQDALQVSRDFHGGQ